MPKHLTTLPHGTALPDPTTVPDGYPFLLESGAGAALKRMLYQNQGGSWQVAGGGGGGGAVMYGPLVPVPAGKDGTAPDWWITPDGVQNSPQGTAPSISWSHTSNDTSVPAANDPAGAALVHSWTFGVRSGVEDADYDFEITVPDDMASGGTDPFPGRRAQRLDFRLWLPSYNNMFVMMLTDAYEYTDVFRQVPVWSAVDEHDAMTSTSPTAGYYGGSGYPPDYYAALWMRKGGRAQWVDYSVTIPNGTSRAQFVIWHDGGYDPSIHGYPKITDIRGTYLDDTVDNGTIFVEMTTSSLWLFDKSVKFPNKTAADTNDVGYNGGGGWYRVYRGPLLDDDGVEFEPAINTSKYFIGDMYFSDLFDLSGAKFGKQKYAQIGVDYSGTLPSQATQPAFDDNFIRPDQLLDDGYYDYLFGGTQAVPYTVIGAGVMDPPAAPAVATGFGSRPANSVFDGVASFFYETTYLTPMSHSGSGAATAPSPASASVTPTATGIVSVTLPPFTAGVSQVQIWRSTSATGTFSLVGTINPWDLGTSKAPFNGSTGTYGFVDGGAPAQATNAPAADTGTVDVGLFETGGMTNFRADSSAAPYALVVVDTGAADNTMTLTWGGAGNGGFAPMTAAHPLGIWFRGDGTAANGFIYRLTPGAGQTNWSLINRVADVETTIASGSFVPSGSGIQALTLTVAGSTSHLQWTDDAGVHDVHNAADLTTDHDAGHFYGLRNGPGQPVRRFQLATSTSVLPCVETQLGHLFPDMGAGVPFGCASGNGGRMSSVSITAARKPLNGKPVRVRTVRWDLQKSNRRVLHESSELPVLGQFGTRAQASGLGTQSQTHNDGDVVQLWAVYSKQNWVESNPLEFAATLYYGES